MLQLGGADPDLLARAARRAEPYAYTALNLNVGCPSDRVAGSRAGATREPGRTSQCLEMRYVKY